MGSSGLIIAFVVALWAAYFVPLVLRRYDEAGKNSTLDLEGPLRRVINPRRNSVREDQPVSAHTTPSPVTSSTDVPMCESARIAAARRRRTLFVLIGLLVVVSGLAISPVLPLWTPAIPVGLIIAWLVACRIQVRGERGLSGSRRVDAEDDAEDDAELTDDIDLQDGHEGDDQPGFFARLRSRFTAAPGAETGSRRIAGAGQEEDTIVVSHQFEDIDPDVPHVMESAPLEADALVEQLEIAVPSMSDNGAALWDPLPITLPTYVSKPRAGRTVRTIDFGAAGSWTSGHVEGEQTELPAGSHADGDDYGQRAVGH